MRYLISILFVSFVAICASLWWLQFEGFPPQAEIVSEVGTVGRNARFDFRIQADAPGLRHVEIRVRPEAQTEGEGTLLFERVFEATSWRGSGLLEANFEIEPDFAGLQVPEGKANLEVFIETYTWHLRPPSDEPQLTVPIEIDLTAPRLELVSTRHGLRIGGVDVAVFRQTTDTVHSGIVVEDYFFPATTGFFADEEIALAFFSVPQDLSSDTRPRVVARDAAGNQREVRLPCFIRSKEFRHRTLRISDSFLERKVRELEQDNKLPRSESLLDGYLAINRDLRKRNEETIRQVTEKSVAPVRWEPRFLRQPGAASVSLFGDRRSYEYEGEIVDRQVHLGFDLASVQMDKVPATQSGTVVFAGDLGIYGQTVIIDHGVGVFSLYGHLSSLAVGVDDTVELGETIGRTGQTGLAGGDHLHFSMMIHGVHVDPVEWWDEKWLARQILAKLEIAERKP